MALKLDVKAKENKLNLIKQDSDESSSSIKDIVKTNSGNGKSSWQTKETIVGGTYVPTTKNSKLRLFNDKLNSGGKNNDHIIKESIVVKRNK